MRTAAGGARTTSRPAMKCRTRDLISVVEVFDYASPLPRLGSNIKASRRREEITMSIALETPPSTFGSSERVRCGPAHISYENAPAPHAAHRAIPQAQQQAPIAMGAHGPELLSYELARTALRDHRLCPPPGLGLEAQGLTSGRLWDRVNKSLLSINGEDHSRLRRLVSKAFTPRSVARLDTTIIDDHHAADRPADGVGTLRGRRRHRPALPRSGHRRALGAPRRRLGTVLCVGGRLLQDYSAGMPPSTSTDPDGLERTRRLRRRHGRRTPQISHRRSDLRADPRRRRQ